MKCTLVALAVMLAPLSACGDDDASSTATSPSPTPSIEQSVPSTTASPATTDASAATAPSPETVVDMTVPEGDQTLPLWPPGGAAEPEEAAAAFVEDWLGAPANLGEFRAGDARSGEIDVFGPEERPGVRATVLLRRLGPDDAWFVIGAASAGMEITSPETGAVVASGPLTVEGLGRGFESTINVVAILADDGTEIDLVISNGGAFGDLEPYAATVDLSAAEPGDTVLVMSRGDTGLSDDTGEFAAIGVTIG